MECEKKMLRKKLEEAGVKIIGEYVVNGFQEFLVDRIPGNPMIPDGKVRTKLYDFPPFFIKNHDGGKFGDESHSADELRKEIKAWLEYRDKIPMVEKFAILHLEKLDGEAFLVERKVIPFNELKKMDGFHERARKLFEVTSAKYPQQEFKIEHIGLDQDDNKLKFFDAFPSKMRTVIRL